MRDVLLDVNVVVDLCVDRPGSTNSQLAIALAKARGMKMWVYAGSVQTLEYAVGSELQRWANGSGKSLSPIAARYKARNLLAKLTHDFAWLAALAGECAVFSSDDPEDEQLLRSLDRFPEGIRLLTRDKVMLGRDCERTMTPESFIDTCKNEAEEPQTMPFIDLHAQQNHIRPALEKNVHIVLHHGKYIMGPEVAELEIKLADYVGVTHCVGAASGSDALLMALMAIGIGPGDEVITTPFTFIATGEMISLLGATPVFVDIDPRAYNIDPANIEAAITPRTKAILPVSLYGQPADFDEINTIAEKHNTARRDEAAFMSGPKPITVIEDAAQSFGATYKDRKSCALSHIACTSFFPSKPLGGYGDGGACFTDDDAIAETLRQIRVHGQDRRYNHPVIGVNGRLDTLQAAIILAKFDNFPEEVELRQQTGQRYTELLQDVSQVTPPLIHSDRTSVYDQYTIQIPNRDQVQAALKENGDPTAVHYPVPLHHQQAFAHLGLDPEAFPVAEAVSQRVLSLPMYAYLKREEQDKVCGVVREVVG